MVDVAMVRMFGLPVGTFRWDGQYEVVRFEYDRSFVGRGLEPSPLMMPVREGRIYSFADLAELCKALCVADRELAEHLAVFLGNL